MPHNYYKERSARVLSRAGRRHGARRRGEILLSKSRKNERSAVGAGDVGVAETVTPNIWVRTVKGENASFANTLIFASLLGLVFIFFGPALLVAKGIYALRYKLIPQLGPMRIWPWLVLAVVLGGAFMYLFPIHLSFAYLYWFVQVSGSMLRMAYLVYAQGWLGVTGKGVKPEGIEVEVGTDSIIVDSGIDRVNEIVVDAGVETPSLEELYQEKNPSGLEQLFGENTVATPTNFKPPLEEVVGEAAVEEEVRDRDETIIIDLDEL